MSSRHCLLSESEITSGVYVFKTYFIAEVNGVLKGNSFTLKNLLIEKIINLI